MRICQDVASLCPHVPHSLNNYSSASSSSEYRLYPEEGHGAKNREGWFRPRGFGLSVPKFKSQIDTLQGHLESQCPLVDRDSILKRYRWGPDGLLSQVAENERIA